MKKILKPIDYLELVKTIRDEVDRQGWSADLNHIDISQIDDLSWLFSRSGINLFNCDISNWDVSHVTNMRGMFSGSQFKGDLSRWNVSNVVNMANMFQGSPFEISPFNGDISSWDVSNVENMQGMFYRSSFNGDISKWKVSKVTDVCAMFKRGAFNQPLEDWEISESCYSLEMFKDSALLKRLAQEEGLDETEVTPDFWTIRTLWRKSILANTLERPGVSSSARKVRL